MNAKSDLRSLGEQVISRVSNPEHRRRLENMVVSPALLDTYKYRDLPGGVTETDLCLRQMEVGKPLMLVGPAGSGKTLMPFAFAAATGLPLAVNEGHNGFDPEQFLAVRWQDEETGRWGMTEADIAIVYRYGGIIVNDEIGRIPAKSQGVMFPMFDARRRLTMPSKEVVKAADTLLVVSTTNPPSYAGVSEMDEAMMDRHSPVLDWGYDAKVEAALIQSKSLLKMAQETRDRGDLEGAMSTRNLEEFEDLVLSLGWEFGRAGLLGRFVDYERLIVAGVLDNWAPKIKAELGII
jgi:hypothetical protein